MEAEDEGGATPLHLAAAATRAGAARLLLDEAGARPEARDGCGRSPLDLASLLRPRSTEIVTPLLARAGAAVAARAEKPTAAANSAANAAANAAANDAADARRLNASKFCHCNSRQRRGSRRSSLMAHEQVVNTACRPCCRPC